MVVSGEVHTAQNHEKRQNIGRRGEGVKDPVEQRTRSREGEAELEGQSRKRRREKQQGNLETGKRSSG